MPPRTLEYLRLTELVPATRNPKGHDLAGIRRSVDRFGFVEPVVLDERTGRLIAGHGRLDTLADAQAAGIEPPDGVVLDAEGAWTLPVVRGWSSRSDAEAEALLVAVNHLTTVGGWENDGLAELLNSLSAADADLLAATGFSAHDLDDLNALLADAPSLDDLAATHGEHDPEALWPVLRFKVPPELRTRYLALTDGIAGGDDVLFAHLVDLAERGVEAAAR